ncbi:aminopeptidase N [Kineosporia sp. J2-2]|uniref:Aminopeptidase N n=1 Tax=Kineosporia corallincola TaxID=2835133 RepID=A0ABS5TMB6_9ACTN|nr:aminopeptidase N [Kineosporia corallincola]MBT0772245.1 aminopeptidase N [Kineosporia corallincola]
MPGTNLTRDEAAARAAAFTVQSYDIDLDLTTGPDTFRSVTTVKFTSGPTPSTDLFIDLIAPTVHEVVLNGTALDVAEVVSTARIALPGIVEGANELRVVADGEYMQTGEGLHRFVDPVDGETYLYTQFEVADARRVFACFDQPDLKSVYTWTVKAPSHWHVVTVATAVEPEPVDGTTSVWRFAPTELMSPYVTALVAGPYHRVTDELTVRDGRVIPLGVFARKSLAEHLDADNVIAITKAGFTWFEETFDCDYPFPKYDQLFVPEFNAGAMENAGTVTITEVYVFRSRVPKALIERRALTILHELAHMWFGDLVTMRWWDDLWLNESFAEYASTRCQAEATEWATSWTTFSSAEKSWAYRQDQLSSTHPIVADMRDLEDVEVNFDGITYAKGASVLKQLVHWVGQADFDAGLRQYFKTHAWGNTTLKDLLGHLEQTSGRDLDSWSQAWLQTAGVNTLRPVIETGEDRVITRFAIAQEATAEYPHLRPHRLVVGGYDLVEGRLRRTTRIELDVTGELTEVPQLTGSARPDLILINDEDLAYTKIRLDAGSLDTAIGHLSDFEDSLARTLIWGAAWDMTRDAELPARTFADLVLSHIASVDDPSVAQTLLRQLSATLESYVAPEFREETSVAAADRLLALLKTAEPGSDTQLLLARSFAAHASTKEQLGAIAALLSGDLVVEGLAVDTEMRWGLLTALVAGGLAGEPEITAELARDDTATGRVHAAAARAAVPTAEAKAAAWKSVVEDGDLPNTVQQAVIGGFSRVHDRALLAPYVAPYFAALSGLYAERTSEMAAQIATGLYPSGQPVTEVLAATQTWLDGTDAEPALRRLVVEGRDAVERAGRAQARDLQG